MTYLQRELSKVMKNDNQRKAYLCNGNCVVQAGPGSGKTAILTLKIMRLLTEQIVQPQGLACLTFNNEAVREFKNRLTLLGLPRRPNVFLGTVHSFCLSSVIRPFAKVFRPDLPKPLRVASDKVQASCLRSAMDKIGLNIPVSHFRTAFDRYRRTHLDRTASDWLDDEEYAEAIVQYESILRRGGYVDFDDLILIALSMIEHEPYLRRCLSARYPWFIIDEYQDLGYPLHRLILSLLNTGAVKIFAVGDADQSIYGFAGATPIYFNELAERSDVSSIRLELNYRCGQNIINGACVVLSPDNPTSYRSSRGDNEPGEIFFFERPGGLEDQANFIAQKILPQLDEAGYEPKEVAILYIDYNDARVIIQALDDNDIKYAGERDQRYRRTPVIRWIEATSRWCCGMRGENGIRFSDLLSFWIGLIEAAGRIITDDQLLGVIRRYFSVLTELQHPNMQLDQWLSRLADGLSLNGILSLNERAPDEKQAFSEVISACDHGSTLAGFSVADLAGCGPNANRITLTTLHSSKGLQFDVVIIPGLEEGRLPNYRAESAAALREARRTFYVGFTRARHLVYLLYSGWYQYRHWTFNNGPSRFVIELRTSLRS